MAFYQHLLVDYPAEFFLLKKYYITQNFFFPKKAENTKTRNACERNTYLPTRSITGKIHAPVCQIRTASTSDLCISDIKHHSVMVLDMVCPQVEETLSTRYECERFILL